MKAQALSAYLGNGSGGGSGVIVGVVDSGVIPTNPEFAGRINPNSRDIASNRGLGDDGNHGSEVAGVLLGAKNDSSSHGVAFNATLLALRTDTPGSCAAPNPDVQGGCFHTYANISTAIDLARTTGARVINLSIVGPAATSELLIAIDRATAAGIIIVIAAGNDRAADPTGLAQLANGPEARGLVIVAGAIDGSSALTSFSNRAGNSASHFLTALGQSVQTVNAAGTPISVSGTSFSAPVISGAVALLAQAFPTLTGAQIVDLLTRTATDLGAAGNDTMFGFGELNLARAFAPQGPMALAGSATPVSLVSNGVTSGAIGDGGRSGALTVILDGYGRAYNFELGGTIGAAPVASRLAPSLAIGTRSLASTLGSTGIALSIAPGRDRTAVDQLLLSPQDRTQSRVLAGSVVTRLGSKTSVALGFGRSGSALLDDLTRHRGAAFLAAERASDGLGFVQNPVAAYAIAHSVAGFRVSASVETGRAQLFEFGAALSPRNAYRGYHYDTLSLGADRSVGPLALGLRITRLGEADSILGARFSALIGNGATSWFGDVSANASLSPKWRVAALWRQGWTRAGPGGVRLQSDLLRSNAWSLDLTRDQLLSGGDRFSLRIAQPLRISRGGLSLTLPTGYDYFTQTTSFGRSYLNLAPQGRERDVEAAYSLHFANGTLGTNLYWRKDPGNIAAAPADIGGAVRLTWGW